MSLKPFALVNRRKLLKLTQKQVAEAVGVTSRTVQSWELGENIPRLTPGQYLSLLTILQCSAEELAGYFRPDSGSNAAASSGDYA
jgi:transcriptional regulator with XRE-family HTH domain